MAEGVTGGGVGSRGRSFPASSFEKQEASGGLGLEKSGEHLDGPLRVNGEETD